MDPRLRILPERRLVMTVALRQALEILQMPTAELSAWLLNEIDRNPLLERVGPCYRSAPIGDREIPATITLHEHLMAQIRERFLDPIAFKKAETLLYQLDEKGYLEPPVPEDCEEILSILQTFDPPGIFARNLQECLLIQLRSLHLVRTPVYLLVESYFSDLLQGRYAALRKHFKPEELASGIQKLSQLSMRPAQAFQSEPTPVIIADLNIERLDRQWKIEIPGGQIPQFQLVSFSLEQLSAEEKIPVKEWTTAGKWICRAVQRRKQILLQIGAYLVKKQSAYLNQRGNLTFLTLQEAAADLQLHPSTLSRALSGKYASTPRGLIPLRSLISASPETAISKAILEQLIAQEEKPLTDAQLAAKLKEQGIQIARRTIAKYRKALKIGSARDRPYSYPKAFPKSRRGSARDKEELF